MTWRTEHLADGVTLYCGDCREILPTLGKVDAVVTSPPYGQQRDYGKKISDWRGLVSGALLKTPAHETTQIFCNLGLIHRDGFLVRYWDDLINDMQADGWRLFGWYVWDQLHGQTGNWNGRLAPAFEFVFHFNKEPRIPNKTKQTMGGKLHGPGLRTQSGNQRNADGSSRKKSQDGKPVNALKIPDSIIRCARETSPLYSEHPARFPVKFAREIIEPYSDFGDIILDPFMGSGTTGVVAVGCGRGFVGIEQDQRWFDLACRRIQAALDAPDMFVEPPKPAKQEAML